MKFTVKTEQPVMGGYRFQCHYQLSGELAVKARKFCAGHNLKAHAFITQAIEFALENAK